MEFKPNTLCGVDSTAAVVYMKSGGMTTLLGAFTVDYSSTRRRGLFIAARLPTVSETDARREAQMHAADRREEWRGERKEEEGGGVG